MLFAEGYARLLLVLHTVVAAAVVAVTTHLVVWMRGFPRGTYQRLQGVRKLAVIAASLYVAAVVVGNVIYPVYKVRVRAEYLDHPLALESDQRNRAQARAHIETRYRDNLDAPGTADPAEAATEPDGQGAPLPREAARIARWFDVKEHWVAFGMMMSIACALLLRAWNPRRDGGAISAIAFLMAVGAAASAWLGAVIGIAVSSYRAIGG